MIVLSLYRRNDVKRKPDVDCDLNKFILNQLLFKQTDIGISANPTVGFALTSESH